jgi:hypothetical protein
MDVKSPKPTRYRPIICDDWHFTHVKKLLHDRII